MRKFLFVAAVAAALGLFAPSEASAQLPGRRVLARTVQATTGTRTFQPVRNVAATVVGGIAETKSRIQAAAGRMFHPGGSMGNGTHEGVGFSTISPEDALSRCCYSNSGMRIVDQSVVRGANGWYATRIYSAK